MNFERCSFCDHKLVRYRDSNGKMPRSRSHERFSNKDKATRQQQQQQQLIQARESMENFREHQTFNHRDYDNIASILGQTTPPSSASAAANSQQQQQPTTSQSRNNTAARRVGDRSS